MIELGLHLRNCIKLCVQMGTNIKSKTKHRMLYALLWILQVAFKIVYLERMQIKYMQFDILLFGYLHFILYRNNSILRDFLLKIEYTAIDKLSINEERETIC